MNTTVLAPLDRKVPGARIAMERDALLEALADHLPECREGTRLGEARAMDMQVVADAGVKALWRLTVNVPESSRTCRQLVFVRALRREEPPPSAPAHLVRRYGELRAQGGMFRRLPLRTPWIYLPAAHVVVQAYPLDTELPSLLDAADPDAMKEALHRAWRPRNARVRRVDVETLAYTPEARVALRFDVLAENKDSGIPELRRLCGKLDGRREPTRLFTGHWAVWRRASGRVSIAPPVGYIAVARISLQEFVRGERLTDLAGRTTFPARIREAAHAIATVHSLALPLPARRSVEKEMAGVDRWIGVLERLCPGHAARLRSLRTRLHAELADRMRITGAVHADFHFANVLADERDVTIIDWDQVAHGDAMIDVGRALASLRVSALRVHGRIDGLADAEDAFLETYLDRSQADERRARLFEAVSLLIAAASPFRLQRDGWEESAEAMIDEVERTLELSRAGPRVACPALGRRFVIPFEERPEWALDRPYAQAALVPLVHRTYGADIEVTECLPHLVSRQDDEIHLRWKLKGYRGEARWRGDLTGVGVPNDSGRGRLRRLTELHRSLASHPEALQVPRPIGHVGPLSLVVLAPAPGRWLDVSRPDPEFARVGRALARLHALEIGLDKERETGRDLRAVALRIRRLIRARHPVARIAEEGFESIEPAVRTVGERRAPTILGIQPNDLRVEDDAASVALVRDTLMAEPLLVAGELAARLHERALCKGRAPTGAVAFGRAYLEASGQSSRDYMAFEALSLLSIACLRAAASPRSRLLEALLRCALERIAALG